MWPFSKKSADLTTLDSESWSALLGGLTPSASGVAVNAETAMRCTAVNAAVSLISESTRGLPCKLYQAKKDGKAVAAEHPAYALAHDMANDWQSAGQLRQQVTIDAILQGDGFAFVGKTDGKPIEILPLPRSSVTVEHLDSGEPRYKIGEKYYTPADVIHIQMPSIDGKRGLGLLRSGADAIGLAILLERTAANLFRNNSRPGGVLSFKGRLTKEAAERAGQAWRAAHGGDKSGGTAVVDNEAKYAPIAFTSVESQHAEQRSFAINEIARLTRVPATMLSDLSRGTWSNVEQLNLQFLQTCLLPWLRSWTDAYARTLLSREERASYSFEFIVDDLLRADTAARAEAYSKFRSAGVMTANDVRRLENMPPLSGGDVLQNPFTTSGRAPATSQENNAA
jgi:HK97 family phage portal protein